MGTSRRRAGDALRWRAPFDVPGVPIHVMSRLTQPPTRILAILAMLAILSTCPFAGSAHAASGGAVSAGGASAGATSARGPRAATVIAAVRRLKQRYALQAVMFGVWQGRSELVSGAMGTALPGVRATRGMYFRIGNTTESFETTLLMQLVDRGKIRLDDK